MPEAITERDNIGRRAYDEGCVAHEERLDAVDKEVHKQSGWLKTAAMVGSILVIALTWLGNNITSKLDTISTLLSDSKVVMMQHSEQIKQLQGDVKDIQDRHRYLDQNGVVIHKNK